jgi:hypothetical protein
MLHEVFFIGPLRVLLAADTGALVAVQDRVSGAAAVLAGYSQRQIADAIATARLAFESLCDA